MPTLPYPNIEDVKVFANEYINVNTMNRALLRLYYNDNYLSSLSGLDPVDTPTVSNQLLVSTGLGVYTWKTDAEVKTLLNITDSIFGLSDVDENAVNMLDGYGLKWDASKDAFVGGKSVAALNDLSDVIVTDPTNLHQLIYSIEYGAFINALPSEFSVGYVTNVVFESDGKVILPAITNPGQQVIITKIGASNTTYVVPDATNLLNGQADKSIKSNNTLEYNSSLHIRSILRDDESIEWVTVGGEGTFEFIDTSSVPGSSIQSRIITTDELMLQPFDISYDNVPDATQGIKGIIQIASDVEAAAGIDELKCINSKQVNDILGAYATPFASDPEFKTGTATDKVVSPAQAHMMELTYFPITTGTENLTQNTQNTFTYNIADFNGPTFNGIDIDTDQIRGVWVYTNVSSTSNVGSIAATYPDGVDRFIDYCQALGVGDSVAHREPVFVPIRKGQTTIDLVIAIGASATVSYEIIAVQQRTFE